MEVEQWADELQAMIDSKDWHGACTEPGQVIKLVEAKAEVMRAIKRLRSLGG